MGQAQSTVLQGTLLACVCAACDRPLPSPLPLLLPLPPPLSLLPPPRAAHVPRPGAAVAVGGAPYA